MNLEGTVLSEISQTENDKQQQGVEWWLAGAGGQGTWGDVV